VTELLQDLPEFEDFTPAPLAPQKICTNSTMSISLKHGTDQDALEMCRQFTGRPRDLLDDARSEQVQWPQDESSGDEEGIVDWSADESEAEEEDDATSHNPFVDDEAFDE
jgi:hypothetical protein